MLQGRLKTAKPSPENDAGSNHLFSMGRLIYERRRAARLSRAALAARAGMSESTLKNLEAGRHRPSQLTLSQILSIPELGLSASDLVPGGTPAEAPLPSGPPMNCWISPGFDPIAMVHDLTTRLSGRGGTIEQTFLYLDSKSAASWFAIANQAYYSVTRDSVFLHEAAATVRGLVGDTAGLEVMGLGCGDGKKEVRLVHLLMAGLPARAICLYLLDISQPLLGHAFKNAVDTLPTGASIFAIQGNFHHLPFYTQLLHSPNRTKRRRLICMLGNTFGNLENEVLFVRNNLVGQQEGDLLLLHVGKVFAPRDQPEEVHRKDPRLAGTLPAAYQALERELLTGPIERYSRPVGAPLPEMELQSRFDVSSCVVPGSYAVEVSVVVKAENEDQKRFIVTYVKRYEPQGLADCMRELGWEPVQLWDREMGNMILGLFRWRGEGPTKES